MTIDYSALKDLSQKEIISKVKQGEVKIPVPGADRDKFFEFAVADSENRKKFIDSLDTSSASPPEEKQGDAEVKKPADENQEIKKPDNSPEKEGTSSNPFVELGYESENEAAEALRNLRNVVNKQKTTIDNLNANSGKMGRELKELREKYSNHNLQDKKQDNGEKNIAKPVRPKRPDPTKFDDGTYDEKYVEAFKKYESELDKYEEDLLAYNANQKPEWYKDLATKVDDVSNFVSTNVQQEQAKKINSAWSKMFDEEIPAMQETYGLKTSISIKDLSDAFKVLSDPKRSVADKQEINEYLKTVPKTDIENYKKVQVLVSKRYRFDNGVPEQNYRTWDGVISDHGLQKEYTRVGVPGESGLTPEEKAQLEQQQKLKNEQIATVPKSSGNASQDGKMYGDVSIEDQKNEFLQLRNEYDIACKHGVNSKVGFEKGQKFKRYCELRLKLIGSLTDAQRNTLKKAGV